MQIESLTTKVLRTRAASPIATATVTSSDVWLMLAEVRTFDGAMGHAYIWSYNANISRSLQGMVGELSRHVLGANPYHCAAIWQAMWKGTVQWGHSGIPVMATALLDMAVWDLAARLANLPVSQMLGLRAQSVPTYLSGLWMTDDLAALQRDAEGHVKAGFRAMKMRVGRARVQDDVAAVRAVREAIGPDIGLAVDFSSAPSRERAGRMCQALEGFDLLWIEDPIADEDPQDHAELARTTHTPICLGEKVYTPQGFMRLIEARACDHLMADLQRAGGVTAWTRIAALADAARLPLSSHILPELNVHLVASAPTGAWLEYMPWAEDLFEERLTLDGGSIVVPDRPGFGLTCNADFVRSTLQDTQTWTTAGTPT